ncbi:MAG: hypothetical protein ABW051_08370 [Burkholderiaceae bacterium]
MAAPNPPLLLLLAVVPLIAWRLYARTKRMVGRQRASRIRPWITLAVFPPVVALLALASYQNPAVLGWLVAGLACGAGLGNLGLRLTRFEAEPEGLFYTPNAYLGISLTVLFAGRIAWRMVEIYFLGIPADPQHFAASPLTLAVFGLLAGYYIAYACGLVRWRARAMRAGAH